MLKGQGKMETNEHGTRRESNEGRGRFDLLPYEAMEALAKWYEDGAEKYGDRNWEKGLSVKDCINRMIRHALKAGNGWTDEDHLAAVMWNAAAAITMIQRHPECNDHIFEDLDNEKCDSIDWSKIPVGVLVCNDESLTAEKKMELKNEFEEGLKNLRKVVEATDWQAKMKKWTDTFK